MLLSLILALVLGVTSQEIACCVQTYKHSVDCEGELLAEGTVLVSNAGPPNNCQYFAEHVVFGNVWISTSDGVHWQAWYDDQCTVPSNSGVKGGTCVFADGHYTNAVSYKLSPGACGPSTSEGAGILVGFAFGAVLLLGCLTWGFTAFGRVHWHTHNNHAGHT
jgi:hypothetical protein